MLSTLTIIAATALASFSRALQNLSIIHNNHKAVLIIPFLIATSDVLIILSVVSVGWSAIVPMGIGGAIGAVSAMALHKRFRQ